MDMPDKLVRIAMALLCGLNVWLAEPFNLGVAAAIALLALAHVEETITKSRG